MENKETVNIVAVDSSEIQTEDYISESLLEILFLKRRDINISILNSKKEIEYLRIKLDGNSDIYIDGEHTEVTKQTVELYKAINELLEISLSNLLYNNLALYSKIQSLYYNKNYFPRNSTSVQNLIYVCNSLGIQQEVGAQETYLEVIDKLVNMYLHPKYNNRYLFRINDDLNIKITRKVDDDTNHTIKSDDLGPVVKISNFRTLGCDICHKDNVAIAILKSKLQVLFVTVYDNKGNEKLVFTYNLLNTYW